MEFIRLLKELTLKNNLSFDLTGCAVHLRFYLSDELALGKLLCIVIAALENEGITFCSMETHGYDLF
jgi:hypothetical protein